MSDELREMTDIMWDFRDKFVRTRDELADARKEIERLREALHGADTTLDLIVSKHREEVEGDDLEWSADYDIPLMARNCSKAIRAALEGQP